MSIRPRLSLILLGPTLALSFAACVLGDCGIGSCASRIQFEGRTYQGASAHGMAISQGDLTEIGVATGGEPALLDNVVYALANVDPKDVVVMRLDPGEDDEFLLFTNGPLRFTPEICAHYASAPPECTASTSQAPHEE